LLHRARFHAIYLRHELKRQGRVLSRRTLVRMGLVYCFFIVSGVIQGIRSTSENPAIAAESGLGHMSTAQAVSFVLAGILLGSLAWPTAFLAAVRGRSAWGWFLLGLSGLGLILWFQPTGAEKDASLRDRFDRVVDTVAFHSRVRRAGLIKMGIGILGSALCFGMIMAMRQQGFIYISGWLMIIPFALTFVYGFAQFLVGFEA
jgi:hypothetical protein